MNEVNQKRFDDLVDNHGRDIVCAIIDRMIRVHETGIRDEILEKILFPISLTDHIPGVVPMDGPKGQVFYMNYK